MTQRHPLRGSRLIVLTVLVMLTLAVAGCRASATPSPTPAQAAPSPSASPLSAITPAPSQSLSISSSASPGASPAVPIDPGLLAVLPATVSGQAITEVPEIEANLRTDPSLVQNAASLAVALGININSGDFAYVAVIQLKPLVFSNAFYLSWRQSYDEGACSQSNGLKATGTTTIAGRQVFIGTCNGGALTYHVHLPAPDRLVSITSVGDAGYGATVLASLNP